eukprot:139621_1
MPVKKLLKELPPRTFRQFAAAHGTLKINDTLQRLSQHFGDNMPPTMTEEELSIPDTKIAQSATDLSSQLNIPSVFRHSIRTFMFGICIGKHLDELKDVDREQFYISCILHKIGLSDEIRDEPQFKGRDFELIGADYAHAFLTADDQSYDRRKSNQVHEAIGLHSSPDTVLDLVPQFSLLHKGAVLDTIGSYKYSVRKEVIDQILAKYPRKTFAKEYRELFIREANEKPYGQVAHDICGGLDPLILMN